MSVITYPANSPYHVTPQFSWRVGRFVYRPILPDVNDKSYTLNMRHQYRPDKLAQELYGTPTYWWVFCERNPFLRANPIWDFVVGLEIMVPSDTHLHQALGG
jgi:Base plate wedge protein 53